VSPLRYERGFYIPQDGILLRHCCENLKSYTVNILIHLSSGINLSRIKSQMWNMNTVHYP
jgi:hypothetical protein